MRIGTVVILGSVALSVTSCGRIRQHLPGKGAPAASAAPVVAPAPAPQQPAAGAPAAGPPAQVPSGYTVCKVGGVTRMPGGANAVLLVESGANVALPIFIGGTEALSIQLRLDKKTFARPLTHDLLDTSIAKLGGRVESVRVDGIENNTFLGTVVLLHDKDRFELDARPSDAIAIALGSGVPIHVARRVLDHAGMNLDEVSPEPAEDDAATTDRPPPVSL